MVVVVRSSSNLVVLVVVVVVDAVAGALGICLTRLVNMPVLHMFLLFLSAPRRHLKNPGGSVREVSP